jgi:hypothetical protein
VLCPQLLDGLEGHVVAKPGDQLQVSCLLGVAKDQGKLMVEEVRLFIARSATA